MNAPQPIEAEDRQPSLKVDLRLLCGKEIAMGPGKANLLEAIQATGSIAAAGKTMNMSYPRAWQLVNVMNQCFAGALVRAVKGGNKGGGATLTELGLRVLDRYRQMKRELDQAAAAHLPALAELMSEADTVSDQLPSRPVEFVTGDIRLGDSLDARMIALLRAVDQTGSINQAAREVGLSYRGAWQMIERANNSAPKALISTATGGSRGGGTRLTPAGRALLALFMRLEDQHRQFLQQLNRSLAEDPNLSLLLQRQVVKTSANNQLFGAITAIRPGAVTSEVDIGLKGGERLVASLSFGEIEHLGVAVGCQAVCLINASEIVLMEAGDEDGKILSARNLLKGKVIRAQHGEVDAEVTLQLSGGDTLTVNLTQASLEKLRIKPGAMLHAAFKSNAVILGVLDSAAD